MEKSIKISKFRIFVKIWRKVLKSWSGHLLISPNQYTKYEGSSLNTFWDIMHTRFSNFVFKREITQKRGITQTRKKIRVNYFFMRNLYMKFQNPSIHRSKVSNFTEKWKNQSKFQNSVFLSKLDGKFSKVDQVIYWSAPTSILNMKALA